MQADLSNPAPREFAFTDKDFDKLRQIIGERTGIALQDHKKNLVYTRLARRLRALGLKTFVDYLTLIDSDKGEPEIGNLVNAITTNLTKFFREDHHFNHLKTVVMPDLLQSIKDGHQSRIRVWSAGCSSGQEPYSIAMTMVEAAPRIGDMDAKILATDLDTNMLATGREGVYRTTDVDHMPGPYVDKYTEAVDQDKVQVKASLRRMIAFKQLNLLHRWPMKGPFDAIFCRNVMIYFDTPTKTALVERFTDILRPGGWFFLGHSESMLARTVNLQGHGSTIYRKPL